ncbi:MAG: hypothetical protein ABIP51_18745 [Bacteroidia bacterium]
MIAILNLLNLSIPKYYSVQENINSQTNKLLSDSSQKTNDFNSIQKEVSEDLERINKMFDLASMLCDIFLIEQKSEMNKWATAKIDDHVKKINNSFLL